jgi:hypothetical protein
MTEWRKSTHSGATEGTDCVEVADLSGHVGVRDSKHSGNGYLALDRKRFSSLITQAKAGAFDLT